jgi:hypothetical protein
MASGKRPRGSPGSPDSYTKPGVASPVVPIKSFASSSVSPCKSFRYVPLSLVPHCSAPCGTHVRWTPPFTSSAEPDPLPQTAPPHTKPPPLPWPFPCRNRIRANYSPSFIGPTFFDTNSSTESLSSPLPRHSTTFSGQEALHTTLTSTPSSIKPPPTIPYHSPMLDPKPSGLALICSPSCTPPFAAVTPRLTTSPTQCPRQSPHCTPTSLVCSPHPLPSNSIAVTTTYAPTMSGSSSAQVDPHTHLPSTTTHSPPLHSPIHTLRSSLSTPSILMHSCSNTLDPGTMASTAADDPSHLALTPPFPHRPTPLAVGDLCGSTGALSSLSPADAVPRGFPSSGSSHQLPAFLRSLFASPSTGGSLRCKPAVQGAWSSQMSSGQVCTISYF